MEKGHCKVWSFLQLHGSLASSGQAGCPGCTALSVSAHGYAWLLTINDRQDLA